MKRTEYDKTCEVKCTDNDRIASAEVDQFESRKFVKVFMAGNNLKMIWNGQVYVGNAFGFEFTTVGPREYAVNTGRGF
jgi:hypothetical protein